MIKDVVLLKVSSPSTEGYILGERVWYKSLCGNIELKNPLLIDFEWAENSFEVQNVYLTSLKCVKSNTKYIQVNKKIIDFVLKPDHELLEIYWDNLNNIEKSRQL